MSDYWAGTNGRTNVDILPNDQTIEIRTPAGALVGYGWASKGNGGIEKDQVQRWILKTRDTNMWFPRAKVRMGKPSDPVWAGLKTQQEFISRAEWTFDARTDYYVKVNCLTFAGPPNNPQATIPNIPVPPPLEFLPPAVGAGQQGDVGMAEIIPAGSAVPSAYVTVIGSSPVERIEYWALYPTYKQPGVVGGVNSTNALYSIENPNNFAKLFNEKAWSDKHSFVIAACRYHAVFPVAQP